MTKLGIKSPIIDILCTQKESPLKIILHTQSSNSLHHAKGQIQSDEVTTFIQQPLI
jgi:hypothetical protein